jgi:hypothetical protein
MGAFLIAVIIFCVLWEIARRLSASAPPAPPPQETPPDCEPVFIEFDDDPVKQLGNVDGKHFTTYTEQIKSAHKAGDYDEALGILLRLLPAVEAEAAARAPYPVAPFYFERAAMIYRKLKLYDQELAVLMRYFKACGRSGDPPLDVLVRRHAKAMELKHLGHRKVQ